MCTHQYMLLLWGKYIQTMWENNLQKPIPFFCFNLHTPGSAFFFLKCSEMIISQSSASARRAFNPFLHINCSVHHDYPIPTVHRQAPPSVLLGWRWGGVKESVGGMHRLPVLQEWGTRLTRVERGCCRRWSDPAKHGEERMERSTASSAEREMKPRRESILSLFVLAH